MDIGLKCAYAEGKIGIASGHRIDEIHGYFKDIRKGCSKNVGKKPLWPQFFLTPE